MWKLLILSLSVVRALIAENFLQSESLPASIKADYFLNDSLNEFVTSRDLGIEDRVNVVTGAYSTSHMDLSIAGIQPLQASRFYWSDVPYESRYGGWLYNPESRVTANLEWKDRKKFISIAEPQGAIHSLEEHSGHTFRFHTPKTMMSRGGAHHPSLLRIEYSKCGDTKNSHRWRYEGKIISGDGSERYFQSPMHSWLHRVEWTERTGSIWGGGSSLHYVATPNVWTPYQLPLTEEKLANGNRYRYHYLNWNEPKAYPTPGVIQRIESYSSQGEPLGFLEWDYHRNKKEEVDRVTVRGSDRRCSTLHYQEGHLVSVQSSGQPTSSYRYHNHLLVEQIEQGIPLRIEYDDQNRVSRLLAPVGNQGEFAPVMQYQYSSGMTQQTDGTGAIVRIQMDANQRILAREEWAQGRIARRESYVWQDQTGLLTEERVDNGAGKTYLSRYYEYDNSFNPIQIRWGQGQEWRSIHQRFSTEGRNLLLSRWEEGGLRHEYRYVPGTNLLAFEGIYEGNQLRVRHFYTYDGAGFCTESIEDDGTGELPNDLRGVTYRRKEKWFRKGGIPCCGLPIRKESWSLDLSGQEILLGAEEFQYTPAGLMTEHRFFDDQGRYVYSHYFQYDDQELCIMERRPEGGERYFSYDASHRLLAVQGPNPEEEIRYEYNAMGLPICTQQHIGGQSWISTSRLYNRRGDRLQEVDPAGQVTTFLWDDLGREVAILYPDGGKYERQYDVLDRCIEEKDPLGFVTKSHYNVFGDLTLKEYPDRRQERFEYDSLGRCIFHENILGAVHTYRYDGWGHILEEKVIDRSGVLLRHIQKEWSPFFQISETEGERVRKWVYDRAGRVLTEIDGNHTKHHTYDTLGRLSVIKEGDIELVTEYDLCNRPLKKSTLYRGTLQHRVSYQYDNAGKPTRVDEGERSTHTVYWANHQPHRITDGVGATTIQYTEYAGGHRDITIDPLGRRKEIWYDPCNRPCREDRYDAHDVLLSRHMRIYNLRGDEIETRAHLFRNGYLESIRSVHKQYDPLGNCITRVEEGGRTYHFRYLGEHVIETINPNGEQVLYDYDGLGRCIRCRGPSIEHTWGYDLLGHLVLLEDRLQGLRLSRRYTPQGSLLEEIFPFGKIQHRYDELGRRIETILPDGSKVGYQYEGSLLKSWGRGTDKVVYTRRNLSGLPIEMETPYGSLSIKRDALDRPLHLSHPHIHLAWNYDLAGRLTSQQRNEQHIDYLYDELDQLMQEEGHSYRWDSLHQPYEKDGQPLVCNSRYELISYNFHPLAYDATGRLTVSGETRYQYDGLNRLIATEGAQGKTEYRYDPLHRRISKNSKGKIVYFLWDGDEEIASLDSKGKLIELRLLGEGLHADRANGWLYEIQGKKYGGIEDLQGSLIMLSDGKKRSMTQFSAFGEGLPLTSWGFASKRRDPESGLIYFGRRYYAPEWMRWITPDPLEDVDGPNPYAYVHNHPLTHYDAYGLIDGAEHFTPGPRFLFECIEWTGANLVPIPYLQGGIESVGRWGANGGLFAPSRYRTPKNEILSIAGEAIPGYILTYGNGMMTRKDQAYQQGLSLSKAANGAPIDVLYHGTNGLIMDLASAVWSKLGRSTPYTKLCVDYYKEKLADPNQKAFITLHSRGGTQFMNTAKILKQDTLLNRMDVRTYGSATLIPNGSFHSAINFASVIDCVSMTNPIAYLMGCWGKHYDLRILTPTSFNPLKEHGIQETTYATNANNQMSLFFPNQNYGTSP